MGSFTGVDVANTSSGYLAIISNNYSISGTGISLRTLPISYFHAAGISPPSTCPTGFIPVPGNKDFNQPGFCVAKYEMTYADADVPNSCEGTCPGSPVENNTVGYSTDYNTITYIAGKPIVSLPNKYPIVKISQIAAIASCKALGTNYHLITNNEWMTIARNIESNSDNWSTGIV